MFNLKRNGIQNLKPVSENNSGEYGYCFDYKNFVLKVYYDNWRLKEIKQNVKNNKKIKIDGIAFPTKIVKIPDTKFAYLMPKLEGINLEELISTIKKGAFYISIDDFIKFYHDAVNKVSLLNKNNILSDDFCTYNAKITEDYKLGIYDTDFYRKITSPSEAYLLNDNYKKLNDLFSDLLTDILLCFYYKTNIDLYKWEDEFNKLKTMDGYFESPSNLMFVDDAMDLITTKIKVNSINDLIR